MNIKVVFSFIIFHMFIMTKFYSNVLFWTPHGVCDPLLKIIALPEIIRLRKARKRKTNTVWYHLHVKVKVKVKVKSLSRFWLFATPWTVAHQAPPSMGFSRQEYWSGLPFPSPGDLPDPGIEPGSPTLQADSLPTELWGNQYADSTLNVNIGFRGSHKALVDNV